MPNATTKPTLLLYCQHSLGIGHLTRSLALSQALSEAFHVVFLNGGPLPAGLATPPQVTRIDLPPLGMDDGHTVVSRHAGLSVDDARERRLQLMLAAVQRHRPQLLLVELFPFGRKKFAGEILPLIRAVKALPQATQVVCSLRDLLVNARPDQAHHDERARWLCHRHFDAVLVHSDPAFARLEDSFHPSRPLLTPVHYSGFVVPQRTAQPVRERGPQVLVSAGGGIVGEGLLNAALDAHAQLAAAGEAPPPLRLVAGPFLPLAAWQALQQRVAGRPEFTLLRQVPDLAAEMAAARASTSQCGYNTALDIVVSGVPALVVPYSTDTENEQAQRARRLAALGALQALPGGPLTAEGLAAGLRALLRFTPRRAALALDGAGRSTRILRELLALPWEQAA